MRKCCDCKNKFEDSEFYKDCTKKGGIADRCKKCSVLRNKAYYAKNKEKVKIEKKKWVEDNPNLIKLQTRKRYDKIKSYRDSLKEECQICGENEICCLDFHHINQNKDKQIGEISIFKKLIEELLKCCVICCNCHRKIHFKKIDESLLIPLDIEYLISKLPKMRDKFWETFNTKH